MIIEDLENFDDIYYVCGMCGKEIKYDDMFVGEICDFLCPKCYELELIASDTYSIKRKSKTIERIEAIICDTRNMENSDRWGLDEIYRYIDEITKLFKLSLKAKRMIMQAIDIYIWES